jgi:hypothetical protein
LIKQNTIDADKEIPSRKPVAEWNTWNLSSQQSFGSTAGTTFQKGGNEAGRNFPVKTSSYNTVAKTRYYPLA